MNENWMLTVIGGLFLVTETAVRLTRLAIAARRNAQTRAAKTPPPPKEATK